VAGGTRPPQREEEPGGYGQDPEVADPAADAVGGPHRGMVRTAPAKPPPAVRAERLSRQDDIGYNPRGGLSMESERDTATVKYLHIYIEVARESQAFG